VLLVLGAAPVAFLVWLTFRRRALDVAGVVPGLSVSVRRRLLDEHVCALEGLQLTEVVALGDDVLVGYRFGRGEAEGELLLPLAVRDTRAMQLLHQWHADRTRLVSVVASDHGVLGLVDARGRTAVVAGIPFRL